ncbi:MAG: hypothetical protein IKZ82_11490 [Clostridia bacterium]|nr:hypothetical protein [Clostridia bacterium]
MSRKKTNRQQMKYWLREQAIIKTSLDEAYDKGNRTLIVKLEAELAKLREIMQSKGGST